MIFNLCVLCSTRRNGMHDGLERTQHVRIGCGALLNMTKENITTYFFWKTRWVFVTKNDNYGMQQQIKGLWMKSNAVQNYEPIKRAVESSIGWRFDPLIFVEFSWGRPWSAGWLWVRRRARRRQASYTRRGGQVVKLWFIAGTKIKRRYVHTPLEHNKKVFSQ